MAPRCPPNVPKLRFLMIWEPFLMVLAPFSLFFLLISSVICPLFSTHSFHKHAIAASIHTPYFCIYIYIYIYSLFSTHRFHKNAIAVPLHTPYSPRHGGGDGPQGMWIHIRINLGTNGVAMARHGNIFSQDGATSLRNLYKYLPGLQDINLRSRLYKHIRAAIKLE